MQVLQRPALSARDMPQSTVAQRHAMLGVRSCTRQAALGDTREQAHFFCLMRDGALWRT